MAQPCSVCSRMDRGDIDRRLAFQVVNVSAFARELGVGKDALARHRAKHLPAFLPAFQAQADALTLGTLQAEAQRLYAITLDALARAEAGLLIDVAAGDAEGAKVSMTAVARFIREGRAGLGMLAKLSADAAGANERPSGVANGELDARLAAGLDRVMQRALGTRVDTPDDASTHPLLEVEAAEVIAPSSSTPSEVTIATTPGATSSRRPDTPHTHTPPIQRHTKIVESNSHVEVEGSGNPASPLPAEHDTAEGMTTHPHWHGNPGASREERRAAGYGDIPIQDHTVASDALLAEQLRIAALQVAEQRAQREGD